MTNLTKTKFSIETRHELKYVVFVVVVLTTLTLLGSLARAQPPDWLWAKQAGGTDNDYGVGIDVDGSGNSYVTGYFDIAASFNGTTLTSAGSVDIFLAKYDASGALLWAKQAGGSSRDEVWGIAVDGSGNSYVTGFFEGTASFNGTILTSTGSDDIFVAKYDASGALLWAKQAGGMSGDIGYAIVVDGSGNSYVTGSFKDSATFNDTTLTAQGVYRDIFVAKYDASGALLWIKQAGGMCNDEGRGIAVDGKGNCYVTGYFESTASFNGDTLTFDGSPDIFVAKYDANGSLLWAKQAGGTSGDFGVGIVVDGSGNCYVTGYFNGSASFNGTTLTSADSYDIFVAKLGEQQPTATNLVSFTAVAEQNGVLITWTTETEANNAGFNIYRNQEENGEYVKINESMIPARGDATTGASYSFTDTPDQAVTYYYKLQDVGIGGQTTFHGPVQFSGVTSVEDGSVINPGKYQLFQNHPNPFNPNTEIRFTISTSGYVSIKIYDMQGKLVRSLVSERKAAGNYIVSWDSRDENGVKVTSGVYFYRINVGEFTMSKKMILMK